MAIAIALCGAWAAPAAAQLPASFFGVSAPNFFLMGQKGQDGALDAYLSHIHATGVGWVRDAVPWPDAEPTPPVAGVHAYRWGAFDNQVTRFAQHGLTLQPVIRQTPSWAADPAAIQANCGREAEPSTLGASEYGAFVGAFLRRYGRGGSFWAAHPELQYEPVTRVELWNEPDWAPFFCPGPDPERYAAMVVAAADAAHAADPQAVVSIGGLVTNLETTYANGRQNRVAVGEFLQRMVAAQPSLPGKVNAVAVHLYDLDPDVDISLIGWLRSKMQAAGLGGASILVTEYGWHTNGGPGSIPESLRAQFEAIFANQAARLNCNVIGIAPHSWVTAERDPSNPENWWGIADPATGAPYPSGQAYADQVALFEGTSGEPAPTATVPVCRAPASYPPALPPPRYRPRVGSRFFFGAMSAGWPSGVAGRRAQADSLRTGLIGQSREVVSWRDIEPHGASDLTNDARWYELDSRFLRLGLRNVRVLPTFTAPPAWADPSSPGATERAFATFLTAFAERYGPGGSFWQRNRQLNESQLAVRDYEIWDRANLDQSWWDRSASPSEYASAYAEARAALHRVDPGSRALVSLDQGGGTGSYASFIAKMVAARPDLAGKIDGAFVLAGTSSTPSAVERVVASVRSQLDAAGDGSAPVYVGFGWYTAGGAQPMSEADRSSFYRQTADELARSDCGLGGLLARAWVTPEEDRSKPFDWYGMVDPSTFELYPTALAYRDVARAYLGYGSSPPPTETVHICSGAPPPPTVTPRTIRFRGRPRINPRRGSAVVRFRVQSNTPIKRIRCSLDRRRWRRCSSPVRLRHLRPGRHRLRVRATDALGNQSRTAKQRWRQPRRQRH